MPMLIGSADLGQPKPPNLKSPANCHSPFPLAPSRAFHQEDWSSSSVLFPLYTKGKSHTICLFEPIGAWNISSGYGYNHFFHFELSEIIFRTTSQRKRYQGKSKEELHDRYQCNHDRPLPLPSLVFSFRRAFIWHAESVYRNAVGSSSPHTVASSLSLSEEEWDALVQNC